MTKVKNDNMNQGVIIIDVLIYYDVTNVWNGTSKK